MSYIEGKVIVITGAASGFGRLISEKVTARGAKVVAADVNEAGLASLVEELNQSNAAITSRVTDVTSRDAMHGLAGQAMEEFGQIDVMINNAGIMPLAFFADHANAGEAWDRCIDINFKGVVNGIAAVYDIMMAQGRGHIINLASIYGNHPVPGGAVYGATKAAVSFKSDALRQ